MFKDQENSLENSGLLKFKVAPNGLQGRKIFFFENPDSLLDSLEINMEVFFILKKTVQNTIQIAQRVPIFYLIKTQGWNT
jgi:hypothetical protein